MLGSINKNKGQDLLLRAFALVQCKDAELHFYGTVGLSAHTFVNSLKRFVKENDLADRVFFPGPTNEAAKVYRQATLLVHSSLNECLSISVLEAMSYGVPVIANDITGMSEIIHDGVNGFLVPPGDIRSLADRITQLLENPGLRATIGQAGRTTVLEKFNMALRVEEFMKLYKELT
jgi:glycosyltransferase involved in cell wall biosynthesis